MLKNKIEDVLDVRAHDRRPKLPPLVAQAGRASVGAADDHGGDALGRPGSDRQSLGAVQLAGRARARRRGTC